MSSDEHNNKNRNEHWVLANGCWQNDIRSLHMEMEHSLRCHTFIHIEQLYVINECFCFGNRQHNTLQSPISSHVLLLCANL